MSKLDEMKKNYQNIEIPEELKERVEKGISEGKQASKHRILPFAKGIGIVAAACAALLSLTKTSRIASIKSQA